MAYEIPRPHYTSALKREALHRIREEGKSLVQVAQELGISASRLGEWLIAQHSLALDAGQAPSLTSPPSGAGASLMDETAALQMPLAFTVPDTATQPKHRPSA